MACCAFAAFIIGQCLALVQGWRRRIAALLRLPVLAPVARAPRVRPRWKTGLLVALVLELGVTAGFAIAAGAASSNGGYTLSSLCRPAVAALR
jgi:hypothetical protein